MTGVKFTANRLDDGCVVWLTSGHVWSTAATDAAIFFDADADADAKEDGNGEAGGGAKGGAKAARSTVAAACHRNEIVAAYEVPVDGRADISMREHIRSRRGPTITPPTDDGPGDQTPQSA